MYRAIIFDFFDVIHADPFKAWLKKHNFTDPKPYTDLMAELDRGKLSVEELLQNYHKLSGVPLTQIIKDFAHKPLLDARTPLLIENLGKHYKVGLISNAQTEEIRPVLKKYGYESLFHYIMISGEVGLIKPEHAAFEHILQKLDVSAEETIFIDDNEHNVDAANSLGIKGLLFTNLPKLKNDLTKLDIKF